jgi:hypothetical protein
MIWMSLWAWSFSLSLTGNVMTGNSNLQIYTGSMETGYHAGHTRFSWKIKGVYSQQDRLETARSLESSLQLDHPLSPRVEFFLLAHGYTDPVARMDYVMDGGAGLKYRFVETETREISLSLAPLVSFRQYTGEPLDQTWILSLRPKAEWILPSGATLRWMLFYQPALQQFNDYRMRTLLVAEVPFSGAFHALLEVEDRYVSRIPAGVQPNDLRVTAGIKAQWGQP